MGHDSQVPDPGDFVTTTLSRHPVIMSRHADGRINVLFNRCSHRGAQVCTESRGNAKRFECPYHGWVYETDGRHAGAPYPKRYAAGFLKSGEFDLPKVPRVAIHRGFVFGSLSTEGPGLDEFLGPMKSPHRRHGWTAPLKARWRPVAEPSATASAPTGRIQMENQNDLYHPDVHPRLHHRTGRHAVQAPRGPRTTRRAG